MRLRKNACEQSENAHGHMTSSIPVVPQKIKHAAKNAKWRTASPYMDSSRITRNLREAGGNGTSANSTRLSQDFAQLENVQQKGTNVGKSVTKNFGIRQSTGIVLRIEPYRITQQNEKYFCFRWLYLATAEDSFSHAVRKFFVQLR